MRAAAERDPKKRVVITGMGVASCFGNDIDTFYNTLLEGKSGVGAIDRWALPAGRMEGLREGQ